MNTHKNIFQPALLLLALVAALVIAGCGGSSGSSGSSSSSAGFPTGESPTGESTTAETASKAGAFKGPAEITKFGKPASTSELEAASKVLSENLEARASADFAGQCASLTPSMQAEILETGTSTSSNSCGKALEEDATPLKATEQIRSDTLDAPIDELRIQGSEAWALYHGNDGKDWAMPLTQEEGTWKVASIVSTELE
jgi:hypothetical protein